MFANWIDRTLRIGWLSVGHLKRCASLKGGYLDASGHLYVSAALVNAALRRGHVRGAIVDTSCRIFLISATGIKVDVLSDVLLVFNW